MRRLCGFEKEIGEHDDLRWDWSLREAVHVGPRDGTDLQEEAPDRWKQDWI